MGWGGSGFRGLGRTVGWFWKGIRERERERDDKVERERSERDGEGDIGSRGSGYGFSGLGVRGMRGLMVVDNNKSCLRM